jgi:hypothetical protein
MPYIKTDRASLLDARSVLYDNPLLLLISLVSFLKLYKTSHELSIVLSFFCRFFKNYKSTIVSRHTSHKLSSLHAALAGLVEGSTVASMLVRGS